MAYPGLNIRIYPIKGLKDSVIGFVMHALLFLSGIVFWLAIRLGIVKAVSKAAAKVLLAPRLKHKAFNEYIPGAHDVLVCTYSKSGTNWALQIITQIAWYGEAEFEHIHEIVPWAEGRIFPYVVGLDNPTYAVAPTGLRAVKTHLESDFVPYNEAARYLIVIRDPKDIAVSAYRFVQTLMPTVRDLMIDDFITLFKTGEMIYGSWPYHTGSFWCWRNRSNVLILFYAEMKQDLDACVRRIADFMQVSLNEEQIKKVIHKSSFAYMQGIDHKFAPDVPGATRNAKTPIMMRSGKTGSASEILNQEQMRDIDRAMVEQLRRLNCDFPYNQYFS